MICIWAAFVGFVLLFLDLGVFHRRAHVVTMKEAPGWSAVWILLGLSFTAFVYFGYENHWAGLGISVDAVDGMVVSDHILVPRRALLSPGRFFCLQRERSPGERRCAGRGGSTG